MARGPPRGGRAHPRWPIFAKYILEKFLNESLPERSEGRVNKNFFYRGVSEGVFSVRNTRHSSARIHRLMVIRHAFESSCFLLIKVFLVFPKWTKQASYGPFYVGGTQKIGKMTKNDHFWPFFQGTPNIKRPISPLFCPFSKNKKKYIFRFTRSLDYA